MRGGGRGRGQAERVPGAGVEDPAGGRRGAGSQIEGENASNNARNLDTVARPGIEVGLSHMK